LITGQVAVKQAFDKIAKGLNEALAFAERKLKGEAKMHFCERRRASIFRSKLQRLGEVEAASAEEAIVKGAEAFGQNAKRLMAVRC
jgi:hypothetical protein